MATMWQYHGNRFPDSGRGKPETPTVEGLVFMAKYGRFEHLVNFPRIPGVPALPARFPGVPRRFLWPAVVNHAAAYYQVAPGKPLVPNIGSYREFLVNHGTVGRGPN